MYLKTIIVYSILLEIIPFAITYYVLEKDRLQFAFHVHGSTYFDEK